VISRAEAFLPRLAASNVDLARRAALDPTSVDIEHLGENPESSHIEMVSTLHSITYTIRHQSSWQLQNLGLGILEQRPRPRHGPEARHQNETEQPSDSESESEPDSESSEISKDDTEGSEDSENSEENEDIPHATETVKVHDINVLSSDTNVNSG